LSNWGFIELNFPAAFAGQGFSIGLARWSYTSHISLTSPLPLLENKFD
jgi:hypothetical protein